MEETRSQRAKRFSLIWLQSRADAGVTQDWLAMELGVSKKTIQNWERGVSSPTFFQGLEWFNALSLNPMPYYLKYVYPELHKTLEDDEVEELLIKLVKDLSIMEKKQLLFLVAGNHRSSWKSLLQLFTAHCHIPLMDRVLTAELVMNAYKMNEKVGTLVCKNDPMPDIEILEGAIDAGRNAVCNGKSGYINVKEGI